MEKRKKERNIHFKKKRKFIFQIRITHSLKDKPWGTILGRETAKISLAFLPRKSERKMGNWEHRWWEIPNQRRYLWIQTTDGGHQLSWNSRNHRNTWSWIRVAAAPPTHSNAALPVDRANNLVITWLSSKMCPTTHSLVAGVFNTTGSFSSSHDWPRDLKCKTLIGHQKFT